MAKFSRIFLISCFLLACGLFTRAQVNTVEFGKNRVQFRTFKWQYYQTKNFNVYYYDNGQELAKFIAQSAEKELPQIETAAEYSLQRRANIVLYNQYSDMQQSNIGIGIDWQNNGGTKLVNNKMVVYFEADHAKLRLQVRKGIAQVITENRLFGDDLGEVAGNQALLDLPKWLTDGYIAYLAENWSTDLDDELKSEMLSGNYSSFNRFVNERPVIAGHAFWYYIEEKFKKENVTYLLYLATVYKSLNKATMQVCKMKFREVLDGFMEYNEEKYYKDIARRKPYPKGNYIDGFDISPRLDYFRFNVNPNKKNNSYVVSQYKKGIVRVIYNDDFENKTILKFGVRSYKNEINPHYPMMAWDPKGTRFAVMYVHEGKLRLFIYDVINRQKNIKIDLTKQFDQVQDMKYMLNSNTLLLSAVKNGQTDLFSFDIQKEKVTQITNDVYDDLDASFVAFPNKTGIIFSSNRPSASAKTGDTILPSDHRYNIFLITNFGDKPELNQISQLSDLAFGNARYPMQYNTNHFTFVSDLNGVGNRYAGFFTTEKTGLDTLVLIGSDILRNPSAKDVDSTLRVYKKTDVDSVAVVSISKDSAYTFPLTNYQSTLGETRIAGDNNQVSEVTRQSDEKVLYKLKIDEMTLRRRNVTAQPTEYMKKLMAEHKAADATLEKVEKGKDSAVKKQDDFFQTEFANEKKDSSYQSTPFEATQAAKYDVLKTIKQFKYKPKKFYIESGAFSFFNNMNLITRYQPYGGGAGPVRLGSSSVISGFTKVTVSELMEDIKLLGGVRVSGNLKDIEWVGSYQNLRRRIDWGFTYYRSVMGGIASDSSGFPFDAKMYTNLYMGNISYPFDVNRSIRFSTGVRSDKMVILGVQVPPFSVAIEDSKTLYSVSHLEYVHDNTLNPVMNIWNGLRYKVYFDYNAQISKLANNEGRNTFNLGFDARYYYPIYRNFIWAGRAAGDFSWGNQKIVYYLGGVDGWAMFGDNIKTNSQGGFQKYRYFNEANRPAPDQTYAFQSLAVNMRGFIQNVANGNNAVVINSEFRLPVFTTFLNRPINNAFLRNFQVVQFIDLGTAWNGSYNGIKRPEVTHGEDPVTAVVKAGGVGPFAGGYGFGARSTLLGYFVKFDAAWEMKGFFKGKPILYIAFGLDF